MTDLEITQLCAKAMGLGVGPPMADDRSALWCLTELYDERQPRFAYDPFHEDAQAMALVKKFRLFISHDETNFWVEWAGPIGGEDKVAWRAHPDLNRAICETVAKMQMTMGGREPC